MVKLAHPYQGLAGFALVSAVRAQTIDKFIVPARPLPRVDERRRPSVITVEQAIAKVASIAEIAGATGPANAEYGH